MSRKKYTKVELKGKGFLQRLRRDNFFCVNNSAADSRRFVNLGFHSLLDIGSGIWILAKKMNSNSC